MLLVEVNLNTAYRIQNGKIINIGVGIFATEFIPKGTKVYTEGLFSQYFTIEEIDSLPDHKKAWIKKYAIFDKEENKWHLCTDDARNWNHSDNANVRYLEENSLDMYAVRDIKKGEELTCDYREFCDSCREGDFGFEVLPELN